MIEFQRSFNIGVATATPDGLIVPVVKNADGKSVLEISSEIRSLARLARTDRSNWKICATALSRSPAWVLWVESCNTNHQLSGSRYPGVHKIEERPVVREEEVVVRHMMNLSLSLDHRVVDGFLGGHLSARRDLPPGKPGPSFRN